MNIRKAQIKDIPSIVELVNQAYRGDSSRKGWTTEADLLGGQRIDAEMARVLIEKQGSKFYLYENPQLLACAHVEDGPQGLSFGILTVHPEHQGKNIGRNLIQWIEDKAKRAQKKFVEMSVITDRLELIAYYERRGYQRTGQYIPFPHDPRYGLPKKVGLQLEVFRKEISHSTNNLAIKASGLGRTYRSYKKSKGVWSSIQGLWKREFIDVPALNPTSFEIPQGQIVGLVGANGAGKTTLLKTLSGLIHPTSGDAHVLGFRPWERKNDFLRQISLLLGQKNQLWWDISPADSFDLLGKIYEIDRLALKKRVEELSHILGCAHVLNIQLRRLSLGERMKMELVGSLLHEPQILYLDEPTIGLDIVAQTSIRGFLEKYVREKKPTIILTSHYMDDITELADRLLLMSRGSLVYDGNVDGFISQSLNSTNQEADFESVIRQFLEKESRV